MPDPAQRHHHRYKLLYVSSAQRRPEGDRTRLHEARDEETKPVPNDRDGESGSKSPGAVTARKNDDSNVYQRLHEVKKAEFGNDNRRYEQRHKEKRSSQVDPHLCRIEAVRPTIFHMGSLTIRLADRFHGLAIPDRLIVPFRQMCSAMDSMSTFIVKHIRRRDTFVHHF